MASWSKLAMQLFGLAGTTSDPLVSDGSGHLIVNSNTQQGGAAVSSSNPLWVQGTVAASGATLNIVVGLSATAVSLNGTAYSGTSAISGPYVLDNIKFKFSTALAKTITVSDATTGTVLEQYSNSTATDIVMPLGIGMPSTRQFVVAITATSGACTVTFSAEIQNGQLPMGGDPVLGSPANGTYIGDITIHDGPQVDAFQRLRVSQPYGLFTNQFEYGIDPFFWDTILATGGTVTNNTNIAAAILNTTTSSGSRAVLQTHNYIRYQPGKSQQIQMTFVFGAAVANLVRRSGYFSDNNGIFLEQNGTTDVAMVIRSSTSGSPVDNRKTQANWNIDTLLGTGGSSNPSGLTLNLAQAQLLVIDLQWLSVGRVRVGFEINGLTYYVHQFLAANIIALPYMRTANLPARYEQVNSGTTAGANTMICICQAVASEGGREEQGDPYTFNSGTTPSAVSVAGTRIPVVSIRPKLTFGGITNRALVELQIATTSNTQGILLYEVWRNATLTGASFASVNASSICEGDTSATAMTGGTPLVSFYAGGNAAPYNSFTIDLSKIRGCVGVDTTGANVQDIFTLAASKTTTNDNTIFGALSWLEHH